MTSKESLQLDQQTVSGGDKVPDRRKHRMVPANGGAGHAQKFRDTERPHTKTALTKYMYTDVDEA